MDKGALALAALKDTGADQFLKSAQWHFPVVLLPDRKDMQFERRGEWLLPRALWLLQEKLNAYASFILDGKLRELHAWAQPQHVRIIVRSHGQGEAARTAYWCPGCQRGGHEPTL